MRLPMLDDDEWEVLMRAHRVSAVSQSDAFHLLQREAAQRGLPAPPAMPADVGGIARRFWHLVAGYEMFTGVRETVVNAIWHHVASRYGPPCPECGKPLRTSKARLCAACGWGMGESK